MGDGTDTPAERGRLRQAFHLVRNVIRHHERQFFTAVGGAAVFGACTAYSASVVRMITDDVIQPRFEQGSVQAGTVLRVLALLVLIGVVRAAGVVVRRTWAGRTVWGSTDSISAEVIDRLAEQPIPWHRRQSTGDLITRAGVDAEAATAVLSPLPFTTGVAVMVVFSSVLLLLTDVWLGLGAICVFPLVISMNVYYTKKVDKFFEAAQDELGRLSAAVHESFDGVAVVKSFGAERRETERLAVIASRLRQARMQAVRVRSTFESMLDGIPTAATVMLVVAGAYRVRDGAMTVGDVASVVYLFTLLVFPLRLFGFMLSEVPHSMAGWGRIRSLLDQPVVPDPALTLLHAEDSSVELEDVHFSHDGEREVLTGVSAHILGGRTTAVVGATGAGKTTLLHILAGLVQPTAGSVTVPNGGVRLVFQEPFLMAGTVRENIALGLDVPSDAVEAALDVAEAGFVRALPDGLDTEVGERGVGLSGGQRQRIALARALVRRPDVLLLDDTTSALDPTTEAKVLANMRAALGTTTVVAVASRPSTIALADDVLFLDGGTVVAHGLHDDLMERVPAYRRLIEAFEHDRAAMESGAMP